MAKVPVYLFEVFAARRFGGNVAGVALLERPAPEGWMQGVAVDLGAPTTGFVDLPSARRGDAKVRFFTPRREIDACGHVSVAVATVLLQTGAWSWGETCVTAAGRRYPMRLREVDHGRVQVELRQRLLHVQQVADADLPGLSRVLGAAARSRRLPVLRAGTGLRHLLVAVETVAELAKLPMETGAIAGLSRAADVDTIGVFALAGDDPDATAVRMRDLCAAIGTLEEPASGTTTSALSLVLARAGVLTPERPHLRMEMGVELGRPSRLAVTVDFADGKPTLARLQGVAEQTLAGEVAAAGERSAIPNEDRADDRPLHAHLWSESTGRDRGRVEEFLVARGADRLAHPGGTLLEHVRRVASLLQRWGADPAVQAAGLCHACYGTDGYDQALLAVTDRTTLAELIGPRAEALVYLYGSCDRRTAYPLLADPAPVPLRDRFTTHTIIAQEQDLRALVEITAANELDVVRHNPAMAAEHGAGLLRLFTRVRNRLSQAAWHECLAALAQYGPGPHQTPAPAVEISGLDHIEIASYHTPPPQRPGG